MSIGGDPWRVLGLTPGASQHEIKAAYRRLAKAFHPDTAGERAMPRFLAIQAAYETLIGHRPGPGRPGARPEPWRSDPSRAREARAGWRTGGSWGGTRTGGAWSGGSWTGDDRPDRPGPSRPGGPGSSRPGAPGPGRTGSARTGDEASPRRGRSGGDRSRSGRSDRPPRRATPGSTSYDDAEHDPGDARWSGASWYGPSSGTYWRVNPKEYADPRKHGPEYQARGRRGGSPDVGPEAGADDRAKARGAPPGSWAPGPAAAGRRSAAPPPPPTQPPRPPGDAAPTDDGQATGTIPTSDPIAALRLPGGIAGRIILALIGWPPLGFAAAGLIGETTGCGRFAAGCVETFNLGTWVAQLAIIAVLLVVPFLASITAVGTVVMLGTSIPAAMLLSATGGAYQREAAAAALTTVLAAAYVVGVVFGALRRAATIRR